MITLADGSRTLGVSARGAWGLFRLLGKLQVNRSSSAWHTMANDD